jgi:WS/DGAT/MGAT family acyltransferase
MIPRHFQRLTATDASFVAQEQGPSHMHIGGVMIFEGPPPAYKALLQHIEARLNLVPRYRQRLLLPRLEMGRPLWIDDTRFTLSYHVRHTALPPPGSIEQLQRLTARVVSQRLDRSKPLWEMYLVEGLEGGRFALINKTHHAMVDGISGLDIATLLFDLSREAPPSPRPGEKWRAHPEPSQAEVAAKLLRDSARVVFGLAASAARAVTEPDHAIEALRETAEGLGEVLWAGLTPAPPTPLNVPIGPHRRMTWVRTALADFKVIKNSLGGTVNDVVLAVVAGALARWLRGRGVRTEGLELRAEVPVSVRAEQEHNQMGNRVTVMIAPVPVYCDEPVERLRIVRQAMRGLKESKQALGAQLIIGIERFAPPTLLAQASRLHFSPRFANLIVTNVPGPQFPLYLMGREMLEMAPVGFLADGFAMIVALVSYNGSLTFGLLGDYDALPDLEVIGTYIKDALAELVAAGAERDTDAAS